MSTSELPPNPSKTRRVSSAALASGRAWLAGVAALTQGLGDAGRETLQDVTAHAKALAKASSLRQAALLQADFVQHRLTASATNAKDLADLAQHKTHAVIAPLTGLLDPKHTA